MTGSAGERESGRAGAGSFLGQVAGWRGWWLGRLVLVMVAAVITSACGASRQQVTLAPLSQVQPPKAAYRSVEFPRDEAPHEMLTEWWYYTGHLEAEDGRRYGFEFVVFQTIRGEYPPLYLGQFAITDRQRGTFRHTYRLSQGAQMGGGAGFDLAVQDWRMRGALGHDAIEASMEGYGLTAELVSRKPPILHDEDGLVSFDVAGDSYYYSYTRMEVAGTLVEDGLPLAVRGQAWFDHQWGDFLVLGGGWDWFSVQLDDGSELMLNHLRDEGDRVVGVWGTYVDPAGGYRVLREGDFTIRPTGSWTSPASGGTYPMGWSVATRDPGYELRLMPVLEDQELVSKGNGPTYWEGAVEVSGQRAGRAVGGLGYVELTGYAKR